MSPVRPTWPGAPSGGQWRSLEQLADTPAFRRFLEREFPAVTDLCRGPERRQFLKLMAASLSLAGLAGCDEEPDGRTQEVPFVRNPLHEEPGSSYEYASVSIIDGLANGVLVTTRNGRPLKVEGHPEHPWSRGGTDVFGQASVLDLYDPERSQSVRYRTKTSSWQAMRGFALGHFAALKADGGAGLRLLTGAVSSPSLLAQIAQMRRDYPQMVWHSDAPVGRDAVYEGTRRAFGRALEVRWRFDQARVVVSLDGDFLDAGPQQVGASRDWVMARQASAAAGGLMALHAAAVVPTLTSAKADHALVVNPAEMPRVGALLLAAVSSGGGGGAGSSPVEVWAARAGAALRAAGGAGLVVAGSTAPPAVQEMAHRLNAALGNQGRTVFYTEPVLAAGETLDGLVQAIAAGSVGTLVMLDANPVYEAAGALAFERALAKVPVKIHAGLFQDETGLRSDWHLPLAHALEAWGDARSLDGTVGLMQPTIAPLFDGRSAAEVLSLLVDAQPRDGHDLLREFWQGAEDAKAFEPKWEAMLRAGFVAGTAFAPQDVRLVAAVAEPDADQGGGLTVVVRPDPTVWDGRSANNGWLQELPKPLTKVVWENVLTLSPGQALQGGFATGDVVVLAVDGRQVEGAVWVLPGQADGTVGVTLGYGRSVPGKLSYGAGYNANVLRGSGHAWQLGGAVLTKTGRTAVLATTQDHSSMEGHEFVRVQREGAPPVGETASFALPSLYGPKREQVGAAWGMVIDLDACTGCNACVVGCQSENNIAVVGKEQVLLGREMHWLRVDRYYEGPPEAPQTRFQPVPCMHCENAPCEVGCPVEATVHDSEGLNLMVYNRCVGTRACSGYCPYKVRHFNYLDYSAGAAPTVELGRNPQVSVRSRGVMEKCTYCVQRIETARIEADKLNQPIADGAVKTACQAACPTQAISFGNLNYEGSAVAAARRDPRNYALLGELNVRPRTTYLAARAPRAEEG